MKLDFNVTCLSSPSSTFFYMKMVQFIFFFKIQVSVCWRMTEAQLSELPIPCTDGVRRPLRDVLFNDAPNWLQLPDNGGPLAHEKIDRETAKLLKMRSAMNNHAKAIGDGQAPAPL